MPRLPLILLSVLAAQPALAQAHPGPCKATGSAIPPAFSGWADQTPVSAGTRPGEGATIPIGKAVNVSLLAAKHLDLAPAPSRRPETGSGGALSFQVTHAGVYRVALGAEAWVDVVRAGKSVAARGRGAPAPCAGIRRTIEFALTPGDYVLQLAGVMDDTVAVMVVAA